MHGNLHSFAQLPDRNAFEHALNVDHVHYSQPAMIDGISRMSAMVIIHEVCSVSISTLQ